MGYIDSDNEQMQIITIKNIPPFIDELFFEDLFNVPDTRCCIHIKDTIPTEELVIRYDNENDFDEKIIMMNFDSKMSGFDIAKLIQKNKN